MRFLPAFLFYFGLLLEQSASARCTSENPCPSSPCRLHQDTALRFTGGGQCHQKAEQLNTVRMEALRACRESISISENSARFLANSQASITQADDIIARNTSGAPRNALESQRQRLTNLHSELGDQSQLLNRELNSSLSTLQALEQAQHAYEAGVCNDRTNPITESEINGFLQEIKNAHDRLTAVRQRIQDTINSNQRAQSSITTTIPTLNELITGMGGLATDVPNTSNNNQTPHQDPIQASPNPAQQATNPLSPRCGGNTRCAGTDNLDPMTLEGHNRIREMAGEPPHTQAEFDQHLENLRRELVADGRLPPSPVSSLDRPQDPITAGTGTPPTQAQTAPTAQSRTPAEDAAARMLAEQTTLLSNQPSQANAIEAELAAERQSPVAPPATTPTRQTHILDAGQIVERDGQLYRAQVRDGQIVYERAEAEPIGTPTDSNIPRIQPNDTVQIRNAIGAAPDATPPAPGTAPQAAPLASPPPAVTGRTPPLVAPTAIPETPPAPTLPAAGPQAAEAAAGPTTPPPAGGGAPPAGTVAGSPTPSRNETPCIAPSRMVNGVCQSPTGTTPTEESSWLGRNWLWVAGGVAAAGGAAWYFLSGKKKNETPAATTTAAATGTTAAATVSAARDPASTGNICFKQSAASTSCIALGARSFPNYANNPADVHFVCSSAHINCRAVPLTGLTDAYSGETLCKTNGGECGDPLPVL